MEQPLTPTRLLPPRPTPPPPTRSQLIASDRIRIIEKLHYQESGVLFLGLGRQGSTASPRKLNKVAQKHYYGETHVRITLKQPSLGFPFTILFTFKRFCDPPSPACAIQMLRVFLRSRQPTETLLLYYFSKPCSENKAMQNIGSYFIQWPGRKSLLYPPPMWIIFLIV